RSARPLEPPAEAAVAQVVASGDVARVRELVAMARDPRSGRSIPVELKAVEPRYPLYGEVQSSPRAPLGTLVRGHDVLVQEPLLQRLGLRPGDVITVGAGTFTIAGVVAKEPDRVGLLSIGPRVLMAAEALADTGLETFGSRVRYRTLLRLPGAGDAR